MSTVDETLVEFDLDTLEPISPTGIHGSDSSPSIEELIHPHPLKIYQLMLNQIIQMKVNSIFMK